jgi:major type 1 subunit fimbrin (pilin)
MDYYSIAINLPSPLSHLQVSPHLKSAIRNPQSAIHNPQSTIRNPQSAIHNPQSAIRNPQSAIRTYLTSTSIPLFSLTAPDVLLYFT